MTCRGQIVRSDNPSRLSSRGWEALHAHGVRTVLTLRTVGTEDPEPDLAAVPPDVAVERVFVEDATDPEFRRRCIDTGWWATPLEWPEMLRSWPQRCAAVVSAVARAPRGGVVLSCGIGRDRTGLATFLVLALAGVPAAVIADDWALSLEALAQDPLAQGLPVLEVLEREHTTAVAVIEAALALGVERQLLAGGARPAELRTARARLIE